jgi:hypothetical protein
MIQNNITNLSSYALAKEITKSLIINKNAYIILSQLINSNTLNEEIIFDDIKNTNIIGINIKGTEPSDLITILYESDINDYTIKYLDLDSSVIRYLKEVEDSELVKDKSMFWVYIKKNVKLGLIPPEYVIFNNHKSQHLCFIDNFISNYISDSDIQDIGGSILSSTYNDDTSKSFNNISSDEYSLFEYFIKIQNKYSCL